MSTYLDFLRDFPSIFDLDEDERLSESVWRFNLGISTHEARSIVRDRRRSEHLAAMDQQIGRCAVCDAFVLPPVLMRKGHDCCRIDIGRTAA